MADFFKTIKDTSEGLYKEKMSKFVEANEKIAEAVVSGYKKIEDGVVGGYKKIETGVVEGFEKVTDKCVEVMFAKKGETVEEAKNRLSGKAVQGKENDEATTEEIVETTEA